MNQILLLNTIKPFDELSIEYNDKLIIQDTLWNNASNYIYYHLLDSNSERFKIKNADQNVSYLYNIIKNDEKVKIYRQSITEALYSKVNSDTDFKNLLLSTGESRLIYRSNYNPILGLVGENQGLNLLGKILEQQRFRIKSSLNRKQQRKKKELEEDELFFNYIAYKQLSKYYLDGNDITEFEGLNSKQIIDKLNSNINFTKENVMKIYKMMDISKKKNLKIKFLNTHNFILGIKKDNIEQLYYKQLSLKKSLIFDEYINYIINKHYPNIPIENYNKVKKYHIDNLDWVKKNNFEERLFKLYKERKLEDIQFQLDEKLSNIYFPNIEDIQNIKIMEYIPLTQNDKTPTQSLSQETINFGVMLDNKYKPFNPDYYSLFVVDFKQFPNIFTYILFKLFLSLKPTNKMHNDSYIYNKYLINYRKQFYPIQNIYNKYIKKDIIQHRTLLLKFTDIALKQKFKNSNLQDILIHTNKKNIVWNDINDPILGIGPDGKGENYIGKYLMLLRDNIKNKKIDIITTQNILKYFKSDSFFRNLNKKKLNLIMNLIIIIQNNLKDKYGYIDTQTPSFVQLVIDKFFKPCTNIILQTDIQLQDIPNYLLKPIKRKFNNEQIQLLLGKAILSNIYYIIQNKNINTRVDIISYINKAQHSLSNLHFKPTLSNLLPDHSDNIIANSLLNILIDIKFINNKYTLDQNINKNDIQNALKILINDKYQDINIQHNKIYNNTNNLREYIKLHFGNDQHINNILYAIDTFKNSPLPIDYKNNRLNFYSN